MKSNELQIKNRLIMKNCLISLIRGDFLEIIKVCTGWTNILRG